VVGTRKRETDKNMKGLREKVKNVTSDVMRVDEWWEENEVE